jgi:hypothetical protein
MNRERTIFSQILDFLPKYEFDKCVERYQGNHKIQSFPCYAQFLCMAFAQLTYRESLRDIETCLRAVGSKLYPSGLRVKVSRSTLADANLSRDWRIYADFAQVLIQMARNLYSHESLPVELDQTVYALDSTTIDLCLSLFPWAQFRKTKAAVKLHTLLDIRGSIPTVIIITNGKVHDVNILDNLLLEPGAFYVMDRGYLDFKRLYRMSLLPAYFVTRAKRNLQSHRVYSRKVDKTKGLRADQTILLDGLTSAKNYPDKIRRIVYYDTDTQKRFVFLTNNFVVEALSIALLYKCRWQIELFFKWIKQHLRIKAFYGTSENAVKTQIWISVATYVLITIVKFHMAKDLSLYTILQIFSVTLFEKTPISQAFSLNSVPEKEYRTCNQLSLF